MKIRLLVAMAAIFLFRIWTQYFAQANIQKFRILDAEGFHQALQRVPAYRKLTVAILKPLFGLTDFGDYLHHTFSKHLQNYLSMWPSTSDLALHTNRIHDALARLIRAYVDDTIATGSASFEEKKNIYRASIRLTTTWILQCQMFGLGDPKKDRYITHYYKY